MRVSLSALRGLLAGFKNSNEIGIVFSRYGRILKEITCEGCTKADQARLMGQIRERISDHLIAEMACECIEPPVAAEGAAEPLPPPTVNREELTRWLEQAIGDVACRDLVRETLFAMTDSLVERPASKGSDLATLAAIAFLCDAVEVDCVTTERLVKDRRLLAVIKDDDAWREQLVGAFRASDLDAKLKDVLWRHFGQALNRQLQDRVGASFQVISAWNRIWKSVYIPVLALIGAGLTGDRARAAAIADYLHAVMSSGQVPLAITAEGKLIICVI